jgi:hypothetical protein
VSIQPQGVQLHPQRVVAIPRLEGPGVRGVPGGAAHGFLPIDSSCAVPGTGGRVFAAGDSAAYPIKHGGLGSQMADSAAAGIARLAGADAETKPFWPVIQGKLLSGDDPLYVSARVVGAQGFQSEIHQKPPWPEDEKVVAAGSARTWPARFPASVEHRRRYGVGCGGGMSVTPLPWMSEIFRRYPCHRNPTVT